MARIDTQYAVVVFASGSRSMYPISSLTDADKNWLTKFAAEHPLAHGNSKVVVVAAETKPAKKTIDVSKTEGSLETVQLCPPAVIRNQDGNFCYTFATVHCMDIAGYVIPPGSIEAIQDHAQAVDPVDPWKDRDYAPAVSRMVLHLVSPPMVHYYNHQEAVSDWVRDEIRKGRPVLTAFPQEIWQALPPDFIAKMGGWDGGPEGHAVVINGFTYDHAKNVGTFHVVNSWDSLQQFDMPTDAAKGYIYVYYSLSPRGEQIAKASALEIVSITDLGARGDVHLYKVETNQGTRRVAAKSEDDARSLVLNP